MKGSALASRFAWVEKHRGSAGLGELARGASDDLSDLIERGAVMSKWYPFELFIELNAHLDTVFGNGDLGLIRELARFGADANLTTIYRLFYRVGTVKWLLSRATRLWKLHYDSGSFDLEWTLENSVIGEISNFETPHPIHCIAVMAWAERSVELSGGTGVFAEELSCRARGDDACKFSLSWE